MSTNFSLTLGALLLAALPALPQTATSVSISGSVVDASGSPVSGTQVYYNNSPATVRDHAGHMQVIGPVIKSSVTTAKDGTFSITALPPGVYWLCADVAQQTQIRSCDWGLGGMKIDLTKTSSATNAKLQLHSGVTLTFQVSDPKNHIKDFPSGVVTPGATGNFRIFVVSGQLVKTAQLISASGGVHQYAITVPSTMSLRIMLDTKLTVTSPQSAAIVPGKPADTVAMSGLPVTYKMTVE